MLDALKRKNRDYGLRERWLTSVASAALSGLVGYFALRSADSFAPSSVVPPAGAVAIGLIAGLVGYRYPKAMHLSVLALPLLVIGS